MNTIEERASFTPLRILLLLSLYLFSMVVVCSQPAARRSANPDYFLWLKSRQDYADYNRIVLKNNLRLLTAENHENPTAVVEFHLALSDLPEVNLIQLQNELGLRLLFSGSAKRTAAQLNDQLWASGHRWEFDAGSQEAVLRMICPPEEMTRNMELYADMFLGSLWSPDTLQMAKEGMVRHLRMEYSRQITGFDMVGTLRRNWWGISTLDRILADLEAISIEAMQSWRKRYLVPQNLTVVLYGDFHAETVIREAVRRFKEMPSSPAEAISRDHQGKKKETASGELLPEYISYEADTERAIFQVKYAIPPESDPDYPAILAAGHLLGTGDLSLAWKSSQGRKRIAERWDTVLHSHASRSGWFLFQAECLPENIDSLELNFFSEMERSRGRTCTRLDTLQGVHQAKMAFFSQLEAPWGRSEHVWNNEILGRYRNWWAPSERLDQVKPEDIQRAIGKYFTFTQAFVREILPRKSNTKRYTAATFQSTIQGILSLVKTEGQEKDSAIRNGEDEEKADWKPIRKNAYIAEVKAPDRTSILRGPDLFLWENPSLPFVDIGIYYPGGVVLENEEQSGLTRFLLWNLMYKEKDLRSQREWERLMRYGVTIRPVVEMEYFGFSIRVPSIAAWDSLDLLRQWIKNPEFNDQTMAEARARLSFETLRSKDDLPFRKNRLWDQALYGGHAYGRSGFPSHPTVLPWGLPQLQEWYGKLMENKLPVVMVLGDIQGTELAVYFAKHFSGSKFSYFRPETSKVVLLKEKKRLAAEDPDTDPVDSMVLAGPEGENEEIWLMELALQLLDKELNGEFLPPLWGEESNHLTELRVGSRGSGIHISYALPEKQKADGCRALVEAVRRFSSRVRDRDWQKAKDLLRYQIQLRIRKREDLLQFLTHGFFIHRQLLSPAWIASKVRNVPLSDFQETIERYLSQENYVESCR